MIIRRSVAVSDGPLRHDGCGGRAGKMELLTGIEGVSRPVRKMARHRSGVRQFIARGLPDDPYCQQISGAPGARVCGQGPCGAISSGAQAEGQETAHGAESASGGVDEIRLARLRAAWRRE